MSTRLPPELLDHIFQCLRASSDIPSLRACANVNARFASLVEPHAWYHLTITNFATQSTSTASAHAAGDVASPSFSTKLGSSLALQVLTDKPHIAVYIRSLTLCVVESPPTLPRSTPRLSGDDDIARILPLIPHLERVVLSARDHRVGTYWVRLGSAVRKAFINALRAPSLRDIEICKIATFPLEVLHVCTSLERLKLDGHFTLFGSPRPKLDHLTRSLTPHGLGAQSRTRAQLKYLSLQDCGTSFPSIVAWLCSNSDAGARLEGRPDISKLTHIKAAIPNQDDRNHLLYILSACKHSLVALEIDPGIAANSFNDTDPPTHFFRSALSEIIIQIPIKSPIALQGLITVPSTISMPVPCSLSSSLSSLEHLRLKLRVVGLEHHGINNDSLRAVWDIVQAFRTPFAWVRRLLEELSPSLTPSASREIQRAPSAPHTSRSLSLERLSLDVSFDISPDDLREISWAPLSAALSALASSVPSLKCVELRVGRGISKPEIVLVLQEDPHLGVLVREGLLKILDR